MPRKIFLPLFALLLNHASAQQFRLIKTDFIGGAHYGIGDYQMCLTRTKDNGFIFASEVADSGTGDIPRSTVFPPRDTTDVLLIKLDSNGKKQWAARYGGHAIIGPSDICQTPDGGYAVLGGLMQGKRSGDLVFDRLDAAGNYLWSSKNYGSSRQEGCVRLINTPDHGFLISGVSLGADGDIPYNYSMPLVAFQPADVIVLKTDSLGNKQWLKVLGSRGDESFGSHGLVTDGTNYYVAFAAQSIDHDCADSLRIAMHSTGYSPYVIKLDRSGNKIWSTAVGGGYVSDAIFDPRDSSIVVVGDGSGIFEFPKISNTVDLYLFKIGRDGKYRWARMYGSVDDYDRAGSASVRLAPNGGYYVCGTYEPNKPPYYFGGSDDWIILTDSVGNEVTKSIFGGLFNEHCFYVEAVSDGVAAFGLTNSYQFSEGTGHNLSYTYTPHPDGYPPNLYISHFQLWANGVGSEPSKQSLRLYPNPARHRFAVALPSQATAGTLRCYDAAGRMVFQKAVSAGMSRINVETDAWVPGAYSVSWQGNGTGNKITARLIIQ